MCMEGKKFYLAANGMVSKACKVGPEFPVSVLLGEWKYTCIAIIT